LINKFKKKEMKTFIITLLLGLLITFTFFLFVVFDSGWTINSLGYLIFAILSGLIFGLLIYIVLKWNESEFFAELSRLTQKKIGFTLYRKRNLSDIKNLHSIMYSNYNDFIDKVYDVIVNIKGSSEKVLSLAEELSASTEEINSTTEEISSSVQDMASTAERSSKEMIEIISIIDNLVNSIIAVANNAKEASEIATSANVAAKEGSKTAKELVEKMNHISNSVDGSSSIIKGLDDKSTEISKIVEVIGKIAENTNLLALNAAIEASRAGEAGKGFAVVADEIRQLAERSKGATGKIGTIISNIQTETDSAVNSMEKNLSDTKEGTDTINKSKTVLDNIATVVDKSSAKIMEISGSTEMQRAATNTVVKFLNNMRDITEDSASRTQEVSASIEEQTSAMQNIATSSQKLAEEALSLRDLLMIFNVSTPVPKNG